MFHPVHGNRPHIAPLPAFEPTRDGDGSGIRLSGAGGPGRSSALPVKLASDDGSSVDRMQLPSTNPSSPTSNIASPDLGTACSPKRYITRFVAGIVQKSRPDGRCYDVGRKSDCGRKPMIWSVPSNAPGIAD